MKILDFVLMVFILLLLSWVLVLDSEVSKKLNAPSKGCTIETAQPSSDTAILIAHNESEYAQFLIYVCPKTP